MPIRTKRPQGKGILPSFMAAWMALGLAGCGAMMDKGFIYKTDEAAVRDSTYVYGYAILGEQSELQLGFRNVATKERKTYKKTWPDDQTAKEHLFVFSLPEGTWVFDQLETRGGRSGGWNFPVKRKFEVRKGFGNYLGRFETDRTPLKEILEDSTLRREEKSDIDARMEKRFEGFDSLKTAPVSFKA
jgi:hypothetical protein